MAPLKGELSLKATEGLKCAKYTFLLRLIFEKQHGTIEEA